MPHVLRFGALHFIHRQQKDKNEPFSAFKRMKKMAHQPDVLLAYIIREWKTTVRHSMGESF